jgi:transcriptional regulator with XRE-family HTH domain
MPQAQFRSQLRGALDASPLSQRELAKTSGVSKQTVTNWLKGTHEPRLGELRKIAGALGVSVAFLVGEAGEVPVDGSSAADDLVDGLARLKAAALVKPLADNAGELLDLLTTAEHLARRPNR